MSKCGNCGGKLGTLLSPLKYVGDDNKCPSCGVEIYTSTADAESTEPFEDAPIEWLNQVPRGYVNKKGDDINAISAKWRSFRSMGYDDADIARTLLDKEFWS